MCGETLERLPGRFWESSSPEFDLAEEPPADSSAGDPVGSFSFLSSPSSPCSTRSLSSSTEARGSKQWRTKAIQRARDRKCGEELLCTSWDVAAPVPPPASPRLSSPSSPHSIHPFWPGIKIPVLALTTFVENVINASEWTRVRSRDRRPNATPSSSSASGRGRSIVGASSIWIKKRSARPSVGPLSSGGPPPDNLDRGATRKTGLHRFLGFHWHRQREFAPVRGDHRTEMAGKPPPGIPGANGRATPLTFGQQRQSGGGGFGGNFNTGSSSGGSGNGAGFSQGGAQFGSGAGFGFNAGPPGN
jgi:hypothetical protein